MKNNHSNPNSAKDEKFLNVITHLEDYHQVPPHLKKEVFNTLDSLELFSDIFDLFTIKFTRTEANFLDPKNCNENPGE